MNKEENLPAGEDRVPNEQPGNEVAKADAAKNEEISSTVPVGQVMQAPLINPQTEKDMEVHHHPDLHHKKKNFKEYFLEFLMIFLAVTMGFFAENVREHFTEKARGKEYIHSFTEDLQSDTAQYNKLIIEFIARDSALKNMDDCFDSLNVHMKYSATLKTIVKNSFGFTDFIYTDRTIQQIKNAGGLHLIENKEIENHILQYDAEVRSDLIHQQSMENTQNQTINGHVKMIGYKALKTRLSKKDNIDGNNNSELLTTDKRELNEYFNNILLFRNTCRGQLLHLEHLRDMAVNLLAFLKKSKD
ncbi:MAG: hypothetical protein ABJA37_13210 [Ferruginibacter sp.]